MTTLPPKGTRRYTVTYQRHGQPRPYADSIYEFTIFSEWISWTGTPTDWTPGDLNEDLMTKAARTLGHDWKDKPDWHEPSLVSKHKIGPGLWSFTVKQAYTD